MREKNQSRRIWKAIIRIDATCVMLISVRVQADAGVPGEQNVIVFTTGPLGGDLVFDRGSVWQRQPLPEHLPCTL